MQVFKWFVLRVRGGKEENIKKNIESTISDKNLANYFDKIVMPCKKTYVKQKGQKVIKKKYLGYIFIAIDLEANSNIKEVVSNVEGVYGFVGESGWGRKQNPIPVSAREVDLMLGKAEKMGNGEDFIEKSFLEGQRVKIIRGPFENSVGTVKKIITSQKKLIVVIRIFKKDLTELELGYAEVKKID